MINKKIILVNKTFDFISKYNKIKDKLNNCYDKNDILKDYNDLYYKLILKNNKNYDEIDNNNLFRIIAKKCKKLYIKKHKILLEIIMNMIKLNKKIFKNINIITLKKLLDKNTKKTIIVIKEIFKEYVKIMYKIKNTSLLTDKYDIYLEFAKIKTKKYHKIKYAKEKSDCIYNKCYDDKDDNQNNEIKKQFGILFMDIIKEKNKKIQIRKIIKFVKTSNFRNYLECVYSNCYNVFISYLLFELDYIMSLQQLKNINNYNKNYKNKYDKILQTIGNNELTFNNFVLVIGKIYILLVKSNYYG